MDYKFKQGDRVKHMHDDMDEGTFMYYQDTDVARVKWDKDGETSNYTENLYLSAATLNKEQEAVMLLLSLGYTVSKAIK